MHKVLVILNPVSGKRRGRKILDCVFSELKKHEIHATVEETKHKNHAREIAQKVQPDEIDEIITIGGDGTINEIAQGLTDSGNLNCRIAVIPAGVGNFIARNLGINKNYKKAVNIAINGKTKEIDIFEAKSESLGTRTVLGCLGVGFDSIIVREIDIMRKNKRLTKLSYCVHCLKNAFRRTHDKIQITVDDAVIDGDFYWIEAVNTREYGGGFVFSPDADCRDGLLDVIAFEKPLNKNKLHYAWGLSTGRMLKYSWVKLHRCHKLKISSENALPVQIDGDIAGVTPVEIEFTGKKARFASKF